MSSLSALIRLNRCPNDRTMLEGKDGWCRACRSTWFPTLHGTAAPDAEPVESREYLRRKIREIELHKLSTDTLPPNSLARIQAGTRHGTLMNPRKASILEQKLKGKSFDTPIMARLFGGN